MEPKLNGSRRPASGEHTLMSWCELLGEKKACDWGWGLWLCPAVVWVMFRGQWEIKAWLTVRTGLVLEGSRVGPLLKHPDLWLPGLLGQELSIVLGCDHFHNTVCVLLCPCEGERSSPSSYRVCVILRRSGWLCEREKEAGVCVCVCVCAWDRDVVSGNSSEEACSAVCLPKFDLTS